MSSSQQEDVAMSQTQAHAVGGEQPSPEVDPITLTVVWNALLSVAEEMGSTLRRTAFSEAQKRIDNIASCDILSEEID